MPAERHRDHSVETVAYTLKRIEEIRSRIVSSQMAMEGTELKTVDVPREASREQGLGRLSAWADALRDAVDAALDASLSKSKSVSDSPPKPDKPRKK